MIKTPVLRTLSLGLLLALVGCAQAPVEQRAPLIPMKDFFRNPDRTGYDLSPDGEHIAFLAPWENRFGFYRAMEEFLGEHLGGEVSSADAAGSIPRYGHFAAASAELSRSASHS